MLSNARAASHIYRAALAVLVASFALAVAGLAEPNESRMPPDPPGRLVDLGGRRLHMDSAGTGSPAVVIENGAGGFSVEWAQVRPEMAKLTQVVTYDRAGYAWSDRGPTLDTVEQTIDDLQLLLRKAGVRPPYVLVGASLGGIYIRAYQRRYPEQVVGLVFVDGTHDEGIAYPVDGKPKPVSLLSAGELRALYKSFANKPVPRPKAPGPDQEPFKRLPKELSGVRHWAIEKFISEADYPPDGLPTAESWRQEFTALRRQRLEKAHPLGDLPLVVLARTRDSNAAARDRQAQLAGLSSAGRLVMAEDSGHEIHVYRPDLVVKSISEVIAAARTKAH